MTRNAPPPPEVAAAFAAFPDTARPLLEEVRDRLFEVAEDTDAAPLTETLKWGEPAYLTEATKTGTTVRLALVDGQPAVLVNCRTTLVADMASDFPDAFATSGTRALLLTPDHDRKALALFLARALTYKRRKARA